MEYTFRSWLEVVFDGVELLDTRCPCSAVVDWCPDCFIQAFLAYVVASLEVRWATWLDISDIVFVRITTDVLSTCVAVAIFASARVWSCCISVRSSALACAACTCAAQPSIFEVLEDLWVSLKTRAKWALEFLHVYCFVFFETIVGNRLSIARIFWCLCTP